MSLSDHIRLYHISDSKQPVAFAVFDSPDLRYKNREGGLIFPFAVALFLESLPKRYQAEKLIRHQISFNPNASPRAMRPLHITAEEMESTWIWRPDKRWMRSIYALMIEAKIWANADETSERDWDLSDNHYRRVNLSLGPEVMTKRSDIRWIMAWQLSAWEAEGINQREQFERTQSLADGFGFEIWGSFSTFLKYLNRLRYPDSIRNRPPK